ncbi:hypothetical protein DPMN_056119 [Dreissena polymorpha]|uniref:Uncharacterized protein n=1 Tax=Dreissena polymorpha TaxID=45954 RepID=A0A9D4HUQ7_DREPO|nr:hypothetical protein DPMN_056119 [Dreissena polymorpha]
MKNLMTTIYGGEIETRTSRRNTVLESSCIYSPFTPISIRKWMKKEVNNMTSMCEQPEKQMAILLQKCI